MKLQLTLQGCLFLLLTSAAAEQQYLPGTGRTLTPLGGAALSEVGPMIISDNHLSFGNGAVLRLEKIPLGEGWSNLASEEAYGGPEATTEVYQVLPNSQPVRVPSAPCGERDISQVAMISWSSHDQELVNVAFAGGSTYGSVANICALYQYVASPSPKFDASGERWRGKWTLVDLSEARREEGMPTVAMALLTADRGVLSNGEPFVFIARCVPGGIDAMVGIDPVQSQSIMNDVKIDDGISRLRAWQVKGGAVPTAQMPGMAEKMLREMALGSEMQMAMELDGRPVHVTFDLRGFDAIYDQLMLICEPYM